jgi:hypothetical protein
MTTLLVLHDRLADTATLFVAAIGIWALVYRFRSRPLDGAWYGAAIIGELLLAAQALLGAVMYLQGMNVALPRPFMHILYGVVAVITLPVAYSYFGSLEDENVKSIALALACFFLWGIVLRAGAVAG